MELKNMPLSPDAITCFLLSQQYFSLRTRDSGFNSEHPSVVLFGNGSIIGSEHPSHTGNEIPSAIFGSELASGFLEHYGLDGPLQQYPDVALPNSQST